MDKTQLWQRYKKFACRVNPVGITLDISRMGFDERFFSDMEPKMQRAFEAMDALERGVVANPDENRMVGHYWLRQADLAPSQDLIEDIRVGIEDVKRFASAVHKKTIVPPSAPKFTDYLHIGIGGSALGPQLVNDALGNLRGRDKLRIHFMDNTDPDGIYRLLTMLGAKLRSTLVAVVSKSGGTPETRNGMLEVQAAFRAAGLDFAKQAVAITGRGSALDKVAQREGWLHRFAMHDWVGGRTSIMSAVGLLPMAIQGCDIDGFLRGASLMDTATREHKTRKNPAALLALMWHHATSGKGEKDMVILPYKDRLLLMSRYLQQLVMESLGKEHDLSGGVVEQGIAVYGNKGSTDQHAYVQQLRDGVNNFFATFINVLQDYDKPGKRSPIEVEHADGAPHGNTTGDFLTGFYLGTRQALFEKGRGSVTITLDKLDAVSVGALIALYERAVGLYASLVNINAYHQPGVEAGKKAAASVLKLQDKSMAHLAQHPQEMFDAEAVASALGQPDEAETVYHVLEHLAANKRLVKKLKGKYGYAGQ
jgi:glucose-6-phosphate isomerase